MLRWIIPQGTPTPMPNPETLPRHIDTAIIGAGFSGMHLLHRLRSLNIPALVIERGQDLGGTWYWNRYPGARCDIESIQYAHSYVPDLEQDWDWSERYATQPELLRYAHEIADRLDLRRDIFLGRTVTQAHFDGHWTLICDSGETLTARVLILATGCLSVPNIPQIPGQHSFAGPIYHTADWPHTPVDFTGQRVGVIGTGSSGVQSIPQIAQQAAHLTVFQRTPNYVVPAFNHPLTDTDRAQAKATYPTLRAQQKTALSGAYFDADPTAIGAEMSDIAKTRVLERHWAAGGLGFGASLADQMLDPQVNQFVAEFVRQKIRATVHDAETARLLCPQNTIGAKRLCVDIGYFETYNLPHVRLVDVSGGGMEMNASGITTGTTEADQTHHPLDAIVMATGFDAMTGAALNIDITAGSLRLRDVWAQGPHTYLGLMIAGFPNLFTVTGPQSPSVLTNMTQAIEQHVAWITRCLEDLRAAGLTQIAATQQAQDDWDAHCDRLSAAALKSKTQSWYTGQNIAGKPVRFMPYLGGLPAYRDRCDQIAEQGYTGFTRT